MPEEQEYEYARRRTVSRREPPRLRLTPLLTALGVFIAAGCCVAALLSRAELTRLEAELEELTVSVAELEDEGARLIIERESAYTLEEIENYATERLGMTRPAPWQLVAIRAEPP